MDWRLIWQWEKQTWGRGFDVWFVLLLLDMKERGRCSYM